MDSPPRMSPMDVAAISPRRPPTPYSACAHAMHSRTRPKAVPTCCSPRARTSPRAPVTPRILLSAHQPIASAMAASRQALDDSARKALKNRALLARVQADAHKLAERDRHLQQTLLDRQALSLGIRRDATDVRRVAAAQHRSHLQRQARAAAAEHDRSAAAFRAKLKQKHERLLQARELAWASRSLSHKEWVPTAQQQNSTVVSSPGSQPADGRHGLQTARRCIAAAPLYRRPPLIVPSPRVRQL